MKDALRRFVCAWPVACALMLTAGPTFGQILFQDQTASRFPSPNNEYSNQMTIGDIDGDGDLDIIVGNGGNFTAQGPLQLFRIWINNGNGVFTDESVLRGSVVGTYRGVELGDVNGDGHLDIILAQDFAKPAKLFINNGAGFFTDQSAARIPQMNLGSSRAQFADIDNDGDLDIYINNGGASRFGCGQDRIWINDGNGFFTDETVGRLPLGNVCEPMDVIFGDIDGDFDLDVRTASTASNQSRLYRNNGAGVFTTVAGVPADSNCYSYDFGDIDGDGDLDLHGANGGTGVTSILLRNNGTGGYTNVSANIIPNPNVDDNDSKFFDYDCDGDLDLIIGRLGGTAERIYNNNGAGVFTEVAGLITANSDSTLDIMVADLNNDGRWDIVTVQGESGSFTNRIYIGTANACIDLNPPKIVKTEQQPNTENATGPYVIRADVRDDMTSDRNFFDRSVFLNYSVNGSEVTQVPMMYSGGTIYRGVIPGQASGSKVSYFVTATDWNFNLGTGPSLSFDVLEPLQIVSSDPPHNAIDARQPFELDGTNPQGWQTLTLNFNGSVALVTFADFAITQEGGVGPPPNVIAVLPTGDQSILLAMSTRIEVGAWTTVTHTPSGSSVRLGYLPADTNADGFSGVVDILALVNALNSVTTLPIWSTDINRSGAADAPDILRLIDLLNGAGAYDAYLGAQLP